MAVQTSSSLARRAALGLAAGALALLGGCVVAPVDGYVYDTGAPVVYPGTTYYYDTPYYYGSAPYYYQRPYYGPPVSLGIWGGGRWRDNDRWRDRDRDRWRDNDRWHGNRPGWQGGNNDRWRNPGGGRQPPVAQPAPPRPTAPPQNRFPPPGRGFGESGMGIDRRGSNY